MAPLGPPRGLTGRRRGPKAFSRRVAPRPAAVAGQLGGAGANTASPLIAEELPLGRPTRRKEARIAPVGGPKLTTRHPP